MTHACAYATEKIHTTQSLIRRTPDSFSAYMFSMDLNGFPIVTEQTLIGAIRAGDIIEHEEVGQFKVVQVRHGRYYMKTLHGIQKNGDRVSFKYKWNGQVQRLI